MDASRLTMTEAGILEALRAAVEGQSNEGEVGVTARDYAKARGVGLEKARREISGLLASGKAETVTVRRVRMDGMSVPVPGYRLKEAP